MADKFAEYLADKLENARKVLISNYGEKIANQVINDFKQNKSITDSDAYDYMANRAEGYLRGNIKHDIKYDNAPILSLKQRIAIFLLSIWFIGLIITGIQSEDNPKSNFMGYKTVYQFENWVCKVPLIGNPAWKWIVRPVVNDFLIRGIIKGIIYDLPVYILGKDSDDILLAKEILKYEYGTLEALAKYESLPPETQKYLVKHGYGLDFYDYLLENRLLNADNIMYMFYKNDMAVSEKTNVPITLPTNFLGYVSGRAGLIANALNYAKASEKQLFILAKKAGISVFNSDEKLVGPSAEYVLLMQDNIILEAYLQASENNLQSKHVSTDSHRILWENTYNYAYQNVRPQIHNLSFEKKVNTYTRIIKGNSTDSKNAAISDMEIFIKNMSTSEQKEKKAAELIRLFNHFTGQRIGVN